MRFVRFVREGRRRFCLKLNDIGGEGTYGVEDVISHEQFEAPNSGGGEGKL